MTSPVSPLFACPAIVVPTAEFALLASHQSQVVTPAPMSVELWSAAIPPPFWTKSMIAASSSAVQS